MNTRIHAHTLIFFTLGIAPLVGCDLEPIDTDDLEGAEAADTEETSEEEPEASPEDASEAPPMLPPGPSPLVSAPEEEEMLAAPINLAQGKFAVQSSTYDVAVASRAVDGNRDGNYDHGSVTHTENPGETWWMVDLGATHPVGEVVISNRTDCCSARLHDFTVQVSTDLITWESFSFAGVAKERTQVLIDRPVRWVKIVNPETLSLAEVEVFRTRNLAYGKPTSQSTTAWGGDSGRAVDGNTNGDFSAHSVTHTEEGLQEWWQVDLGDVQPLGQAVLFNRTDCCADRLHDFKLRVSNDGQSWHELPFSGIAGARVVLPINREGRFVQVVNGGGPLQLAEVQLFEAPRLPGLSYGRGVGTIPDSFGCAPGEEQDGLLCYPLCAPNYDGVGPVCWQMCQPGYFDMGLYCINYWAWGWPSHGKHAYGRGVGTPLVPTCGEGLEYDAGLCYVPCEPGYHGVGPVCWLDGLTIESIGKEACDRLRVPVLSGIADSLDKAFTSGVGLGVSAGATVSAELGVAYGSDGEFGCYVTGCAGITTGGLSLSAYVTAGLYSAFNQIAGSSTVTSLGASLGILDLPISIGGTLASVSNQQGVIGQTISVSVSLNEPTPIELAGSALACETGVLKTQ